MEECPGLHAREAAGVAGGKSTKQRPNEPLKIWSEDKHVNARGRAPWRGEWLLYQQAVNGLNWTLIMWSGVGLFQKDFGNSFGALDSSFSMAARPSEARPVAKVVEAVCERSEQAGTT